MNTKGVIISLVAGIVLIAGGIAWYALRGPKLPPGEYLKKGWALYHQKQYSNALETFQLCLKKYPTFADGHDALARTYRDTKEFAKAVAAHDKAIRLNPHQFAYYWERGVTHLRMNDHESAINDFALCVEKNEECANCYIGMAMAYRNQGKLLEALAQHNKAIALSPERPDFYWERCVTYRQKGDTRLAEADLATARRLGSPH
jgi:tetratricopeptide (TPR) repeat protein